MDACPIWGTEAQLEPHTGDYAVVMSSRAGGRYVITRSAQSQISSLDDGTKAKLTTWLIDRRLQGDGAPRVTSEVIEAVRLQPSITAMDRLDRLLRWVDLRAKHIGQMVSADNGSAESLELLAWTESLAAPELWFLLQTAEYSGWAEKHITSSGVRVSLMMGGYERLRAISTRLSASSQGFVAMWFDASLDEIFAHGFAPAISDAGYDPLRIDGKQHNNKIDDEIVAEIRRSRFLVADFTHGADGARGGVYYEAGFAHGLGIPVIFTVRADMIGKTHFDTRQYAHVTWEQPADLRVKLANRISATIGDGPRRPAR